MKHWIKIVFVVLAMSAGYISSAGAEVQIYTWADCLREVKENHPDLISAKEDITQSQANKTITASGLFPQVDADIGASTSKNSSSPRSESYSYGASASQLLFDGLKTSSEIKQAQQEIVASQFSYYVTSSNVRLRLRDAFIDLLRAQELVKIAEDILSRRKDSLELVQLRYEAGREHKGALLTADANLAQAQADFAQAERNIGVTQRRLNKELGRTKFIEIKAQGDFDVKDQDQVQPDFEHMAEDTPFLKELMARKEAAKLGIGSAKADYFPAVFASAGIDRSDSNWPPRDEGWSAGIRVSLPIFDGGLRGASVKRAKSVFRQSEADERSGRDGVILTLNESWADLEDALDNVHVQKKFLDSNEMRSKISEAQYSNGLITFDDWIIIEDALVRAKNNFLDAQANALSAEATWIQAKGGILENENE